MMGDVQQYFTDQKVRNFYSVSISGYHIAEAGANPISQLAFTLANGFTIAEYYLARGMKIDDFAPNLSFFFSNGMDAEYVVIGRVARRIWARAMRDRYRAGPRSQMLKYHVQTSGRSLHAREISFNDIRTTLQAMYALFDNCNSLHTNAYDEALTTPTEESVRRAVAIQLVINRELGLNKIQNPWQGSFAIDYLTDMVEEAVYKEFEALSERGGVLGSMETMYQRGKIQEESLYYETKKHDGSLPIVGVNTFLSGSGCLRGTQVGAADPLDRGGEAGAGGRGTRLSGAQCRALPGRAYASAAGRFQRRQCVRRAYGMRQGLLAGTDLARVVSGGRSVSSQHVRSGSPSAASIALRACSRSAETEDPAASSVASRAGRISSSMRPGSGRPPEGGRARRVPRTTAGTSGQPTRAAVTNAPAWNLSSPGVRVKVPSGKNTTDCPCVALRSTRRASAALLCRSKRSTNCDPRRCSSAPARGTSDISRLMTKAKRGGRAAVSTIPSR